MRTPAISITVLSGEASHVVRFAGEIDVTTVVDVVHTLNRLRGTVVVDMADVTFIDSAGLRALLIAHRHAHRRGERLVVRDASESVRHVMRALDIERILTDESR